MPPEQEVPLPVRQGELIAGKFMVERVLGHGGMGFVLAARHRDLGHLVAIKMLLPKLANRRDIVERFLREARAAVQLRSEHAVRVSDVGLHQSRASAASSPEAVPFLVMEYLEGTSLGSLVRKGPLPIRDACMFVIQACDALDEAHRAGIVHRDLKPDNLFLTRRPNGAALVKVLDFGISRVPFGDEDDRRLTGTTDVMGTPHYMAPEQMAAARNADARSDVWALGVTLYELLTGRIPFGGSNVPEIITRVLTTAPPTPRAVRPEIPPELDAIVMGCLEKSPERRCPGVADLARALAPFTPGGAWSESLPMRAMAAPEDTATLHKIAASGALAPEPATQVAPTVHAAFAGSAVTLDATTQLVHRRRAWGAIGIAAGGVAAVAVVLGVWWRSGASTSAEAASGAPNDATTAMAAPSASEPAPTTVASGNGTGNSAPSAPETASAPTLEPAVSATSSARSAPTTKSSGTSGLKKTRK